MRTPVCLPLTLPNANESIHGDHMLFARVRTLNDMLVNGAAWETSTAQLIASISKPARGSKKKAFTRVGVRAAKQLELEEHGSAPLEADAATQYRALAARCNYLAADRPDIGRAAKELCRDFSQPSARSVMSLTRVVRYLVHRPTPHMKIQP